MADNWLPDVGWTAAHGSSDLSGLATGASVLSTVVIPNQTSLDKLMDLSFAFTLAAPQTIPANAYVVFWLAYLNQDGSTYGDGLMTPGTAYATHTPLWPACGSFNNFPAGSQTVLVGACPGIQIAPGALALITQQNIGFTLASGSASGVAYRTYNP